MSAVASFFVILGWKMTFYVIALLGVSAWGMHQKSKRLKAEAALASEAKDLGLALTSLMNMNEKVEAFKSAAVAAVNRANAAQIEASDLRAQYESQAQATLQTPVADKDTAQFLRDEASK